MNEHIVHMENGRLASDTPASHVHQIVREAIKHPEGGGVVIHFHGGLVNEANARGIAENLTPIYMKAGAYPIFPVWESGLLETLQNNLAEVAREEFFRKVMKLVRRSVKRKFRQDSGQRGSGVLPAIDTTSDDESIEQALVNGDITLLPVDDAPPDDLTLVTSDERLALELELGQDPDLGGLVDEILATLRDPDDVSRDQGARAIAPVVASTATLVDPIVLNRLTESDDASSRGLVSTLRVVKAVVKIAVRVIMRFVTKRDHGLHATVVEEILREFYLANIGGKIWEAMKQDTADSFGLNPEVHGGTALLTQLAAQGPADGAKITLVGHSTGAVYISHFLAAADTIMPVAWKCNVIFLAPASTCDLMAETLTRYSHRIGHFRMFTMTDHYEKQDKLVPVLYPHSLLYFVSGVVESQTDMPIVGMERYYDFDHYEPGDFPKVDIVRRYIEESATKAVWSVTDSGEGRRSSAASHGKFDEDLDTIASVQHILREGFLV